MSGIEHANTLVNPKGLRPFGPIAVRWNATHRDWCATNTVDKGWRSTVHLHHKRLACVLGKLNVRVVAVKCDDASMYYLCEPGERQ